MTDTFKASEALFCRYFTDSVISWNNAEWAAQRILSAYVIGGLGSLVVLHHLKNVSLQDALLATADLLDVPGSLALVVKPPNALNALALFAKPQTLPEKPTWPDRLKKPRSYLQAPLPQPPPSPAR